MYRMYCSTVGNRTHVVNPLITSLLYVLTAVSDDMPTCAAESVMDEDTCEAVVDMPELNAVRTQSPSVVSFTTISEVPFA